MASQKRKINVDEELLINLVRENDCLYNINSKSYKDETVKLNCWAEIAESLDLEKNSETYGLLKLKWKYIRDCYVRKRAQHNKETASGAAAKKLPSWRHWEGMQWLNPYLTRNVTTNNLTSVQQSVSSLDAEQMLETDTSSNTDSNWSDVTPTANPSTPTPTPALTPNPTPARTPNPTPARTPKRKRVSGATAELSSLEALLFKELSEPRAEQTEDEFVRFGREVADDLRKLHSEHQQALAMREIRDVIFKHRFPTARFPTANPPITTHYTPPTTTHYTPYEDAPTYTQL